MNRNINMYSSRKLGRYFGVLISFLLSSCANAAEQIDESNNQSIKSSDFKSIQLSLEQMNKNLQILPNQLTNLKQPTTEAVDKIESQTNNRDIYTETPQVSMGKGRMSKKAGMVNRPKKCMGKMCKMMMNNESMMGRKPMLNGQMEVLDLEKKLPGYKDVPHIYHLGESDFFLDYQSFLKLSSRQLEKLNSIKQKWSSIQSEKVLARQNLEDALWQETALGQPNINKIQALILEIESTNSGLRLSFIESVGDAVNVLKPEQATLLKETKSNLEVK